MATPQKNSIPLMPGSCQKKASKVLMLSRSTSRLMMRNTAVIFQCLQGHLMICSVRLVRLVYWQYTKTVRRVNKCRRAACCCPTLSHSFDFHIIILWTDRVDIDLFLFILVGFYTKCYGTIASPIQYLSYSMTDDWLCVTHKYANSSWWRRESCPDIFWAVLWHR